MSANRTDWLEWRRQGIGGSDIAALLGLSRYASPWSVWATKVGLLPPSESTQRQRVGQVLEEALGLLFSMETGLYTVGEQTWCAHEEHPIAQCTVDGFVAESPVVDVDEHGALLGVLGTHQKKTDARYGWPDGVPVNIRAQCVWEMGVTQLERCWLSVLFGGFRFEVYEIPFDADAARDWALMLDRAETFWHEYVVTGNPPPVDGSDATEHAIKQVWPDHLPGAHVPLDEMADVLRIRDGLASGVRAAKAELDVIDNQLRAAMGDGEVGTVAGEPVLTYRTTERKGYTVEPTTTRTLRMTQRKAAPR